ncbi:MAG: glycoside hydrolase family 16 protein [Firmicutes bacterium]|nr:glycoside hydrolase family 16 protein [Bacillota bacterium]
MKKKIVVFLTAVVIVFSSACFQPEPDWCNRFTEAVMAIGYKVEDTEECKKKIEYAAMIYDEKLTLDDKYRIEEAAIRFAKLAEDYYLLTGVKLFMYEALPEKEDYSTSGNTGGSSNPGGNPGGNTGGNTGGNPGGNTGGNTGGNPGGNTGGNTGGNAGVGGGAGRYNPDIDPAACTFYDDFEGDELDMTKWSYDQGGGGFGNGEQQYYRSQNAVVSNGTLKLVAKLERYENRNHTSCKIWTRNKFHQTYGRFEAKLRLSSAYQGFWPAFWMMPQNAEYGGWPRSGEIDIMEMKGRLPYNASSCLHSGAGGGSTYCGADNNPGDNPSDKSFDIRDFHVYTVEWDVGIISFYYDGHFITSNTWNGQREAGDYPNPRMFGANNYTWQAGGTRATATNPAPFDRDFYMILNFAIGGQFDGGRMPPDSAFEAGGADEDPYLEMEYVAAYSKQYMLDNPISPAMYAQAE